jgi:hypothetical protein
MASQRDDADNGCMQLATSCATLCGRRLTVSTLGLELYDEVWGSWSVQSDDDYGCRRQSLENLRTSEPLLY